MVCQSYPKATKIHIGTKKAYVSNLSSGISILISYFVKNYKVNKLSQNLNN